MSPSKVMRPSAASAAMRPLSGAKITVIATVLVVITVALVLLLWWPATRGLVGNELVTARFDALRLGLSIGVGSGGVFALYLAWRRQRSTEEALAEQQRATAAAEAHQERVAESNERDAASRRITDLYTKAVDQLGSGKAAVRLGGLYALERLAQDHSSQRQVIVNVFCAYLRMPHRIPVNPTNEGDHAGLNRGDLSYLDWTQEREVRLTAQRLLRDHTRPGPDLNNPTESFWPETDIDLTGATLYEPDFRYCTIRAAKFSGATINGLAWFDNASFSEKAWFRSVKFNDAAYFSQVTFEENALFSNVEFAKAVMFSNSVFESSAEFDFVQFHEGAFFRQVEFVGDAGFGATEFHGVAIFDEADFHDVTHFDEVEFRDSASFDETQFKGVASFEQVKFEDSATFEAAKFHDKAIFDDVAFNDTSSFWSAEFASDASFERATTRQVIDLRGTSFERGVPETLTLMLSHEDPVSPKKFD